MMSWSFQATYQGVEHAKAGVAADRYMPQAIKDYITFGLEHIKDKSCIIRIEGNGHLCSGPGEYEVTSVQLKVQPLEIAPPA